MKQFVISDLHLGHKNIILFSRPEFVDIEDMHNCIVESWNSVVGKNDIVYVLGDVCFSTKYLDPVFSRLAGRKKLVAGNHDHPKVHQHFEKVYGAFEFRDLLFTHIPVHECQKGRYRKNVHGHMHRYILDDPWYVNVCCENVDYCPVNIEEI